MVQEQIDLLSELYLAELEIALELSEVRVVDIYLESRVTLRPLLGRLHRDSRLGSLSDCKFAKSFLEDVVVVGGYFAEIFGLDLSRRLRDCCGCS